MTEAMPFLQKTILLSYDPRPFAPDVYKRQHTNSQDPRKTENSQ